MQSRLATTSLFIVLVALAGSSVAARLPLPPPPDAKVAWIAKKIRLNGMDMQVRRFETDRHISEVLDHYRELWADPAIEGQPAFGETAMGPWAILTREQDGLVLSVHAAIKERGTWGYLGISNMPSMDREPKLGKKFPTMRRSAIINDMISDDVGAKGRTLLVSNEYSVSSNASFYRGHYESRGWTKLFDKPSKNGVGHVLAFRDGKLSANIVIRDEGGHTYITANISER